MRRISIIIAVLLSAVAAFATGSGEVESTKPIELTFLIGGLQTPENIIASGWPEAVAGKEQMAYFYERYAKDHPGVTIKQMTLDLSSGSTMTMDALIAAGRAPDVYHDTGVRASKYIVPEYALPLDEYATDWKEFFPAALASVTRNGKIYGVPAHGWAVAMAVNLDLVAAAGAQEPSTGWTIDDYMALGARVKAMGKGNYLTYLFAANQSSDQWWMPWFGAFGAVQFADGDYTRTRLNSPQGVMALEFMRKLLDSGYVRPDSAGLTDDDALADFAMGKVATGAMQGAHASGAIADAVKQGIIAKAFRYKFIAFPKALGVKAAPGATGLAYAVAKNGTDKARNKAAADLAIMIGSVWYQTFNAYVAKSVPSRIGVDISVFDEGSKQVVGVIETNGAMDLGYSSPKFSAVRAQMFPLLQMFFAGKMTAAETLALYEKNVNAILAGK